MTNLSQNNNKKLNLFIVFLFSIFSSINNLNNSENLGF